MAAIAAKRVMRCVEQHSPKYRVSSYVSLSTRQPLKPIAKLFDCPWTYVPSRADG